MPFTQDFQPLQLHGPALLGAPGIASPLSGHAIRASGVAAALDISAQSWTLRILSGVSEGICNTLVQSGGEFLYIGVGGR